MYLMASYIPNLSKGIATGVFKSLTKELEISEIDTEISLNNILHKVDILMINTPCENLLNWAAPNKLLLTYSSGIDHFPIDELLKKGVVVKSSKGSHSIQASEHVFSGILFFERRLSTFYQQQEQRKWNEIQGVGELYGKTIGIVGLGSIGKRIAKIGSAFGCTILAYSPSHHNSKLANLLPLVKVAEKSDYLVVTAPLTKSTRNMIDLNILKHLGSNGILVNISRGKIVDEKALEYCLHKGIIAGAFLDTFSDEPLATSSSFWVMDNVLITPHQGGSSPKYHKRVLTTHYNHVKNYLKDMDQ